MRNFQEIIGYFCKKSIVFKSVCFNNDRAITQNTPRCVENCSDNQLSYNCSSTYYQFFCNLDLTLKTVCFLVRYGTNSRVHKA